ncbi:hypothetical protein DB346_22755 [Verrucomicrobia bacterium LW23]|nr:hypothetical protein DB346_22755 [Verrucomicrobia bacterium LW23]
MLMYLMNSDGELEWKNPSLTVAENSPAITATFPDRFQTLAEVNAERAPQELANYNKRWSEIKAKVQVPSADSLYTPHSKLTGPHPRYLFAGTPLAEMKRRYQDAAFQPYVSRLRAQVETIIAEPVPGKPNLDAEDPLRPYAEKLAPLALVVKLEPNETLRAKARTVLNKWIDATIEWGLPLRDLPLSQQIFGLCAVYDWLYDDLTSEERSKIRKAIIDRARWMRDPINSSAAMWRGTQHSANHNWFNYSALACAASVLWGETDSPLEPSEPKTWMDEAMENFYVVEAIQPKDGGAMEGFLYQDYGLRPYFDFAVLAEQLTDGPRSFVDTASVRSLSSRVHALLPGNRGFFTYGDSEPKMFSSGAQFRYIASRLKDSRAQLLAGIMEKNYEPQAGIEIGAGNWRTIFWLDNNVATAIQSDLPLQNDQTDIGIFTARSSWAPDASFFGLRCGPATGHTASTLMGNGYTNGHGAPDQGNFTFYYGEANVIPGSNYARTKLSRHHNLVAFEGRDKQQNQLVDQLGGGQAWFGMGNTYSKIKRHAAVTNVMHHPAWHSYMCDLGGVYLLQDSREPAQSFYPTYLRSITYLTTGAVVIVDKIECPQPRTFHFRLLTAAQDMTSEGNDFAFTVKGVPGKILNLSKQQFESSVKKEENYVWRDGKRDVAILTARDQTKAIFVTVLAMNGAEKNLSVQADEKEIIISGVSGKETPVSIQWKPVDDGVPSYPKPQ